MAIDHRSTDSGDGVRVNLRLDPEFGRVWWFLFLLMGRARRSCCPPGLGPPGTCAPPCWWPSRPRRSPALPGLVINGDASEVNRVSAGASGLGRGRGTATNPPVRE